MPTLRIKIAASVDSSVANSFTSVEKAAQRSGDRIEARMARVSKVTQREMAQAGRGMAKELGTGASAADTALTRAATSATTAMSGVRAGAAGVAASTKALTNAMAQQFATLRANAQGLLSSLAAVKSAAARAAPSGAGGGSGGGGGGGRNSLYWNFGPNGAFKIKKPVLHTLDTDPVAGIARFGMGAASYGKRAALGLARSAGVETDLGRIGAQNTSEQAIAQQIVNSGYMPGQAGTNGALQSSGDILAETRKTSFTTATDRGDLLKGLQDFVGKTGDLETGRRILEDMARLSRATGSSLEDVANAGAEVANVLGDVPDKAGTTSEIMRQIAGQGKLGAVEIRDLATQMAKLASQSTKFKGGAIENIALLGTVAQEAKQRGGATNAAQATTAVTRFVEEFSKPTVLAKLIGKHGKPGIGLNPFADEGHTQLKQAPDLIKEILSYTKGDLGKLSDIMPSSIAQKAIGGFGQVYNQTSGTDAQKIAAVNDEFERLHQAQLSEEEVARAFTASMQGSEAKSKQFNTQLAAVVEQVQGALLPALSELAPSILGAAKGLASLFVDKPNGEDSLVTTLGKAFSTLLGSDKVESDQDKASRVANKTEMEATNWHGTLRRWEETHLLTNAEGAANPQQEIANAESVLAPQRQQEKALKDQIDPLAARVAQEKAELNKWAHKSGHIHGGDMSHGEVTDDYLKSLGGKGYDDVDKYLADKNTLSGLQDSFKQAEKDQSELRRLLSSGAVTVKLADSPNPRPNPAGVEDPETAR